MYDADDRIDWLLSHDKFEIALEAVTMSNNKVCKHTVTDVGRVYLDHLLACGEYEKAGKLCLTILGQNKKLWEEEVKYTNAFQNLLD